MYMDRTKQLVLLIVDDQQTVLDVYCKVLRDQLGHDVECASLPAEAIRHARERLFDVVVIDAKLYYKGAAFGGLILADEIALILGVGAVLLMSQYDVRGEVAHFNPRYTFVSKPRDARNLVEWAERELLLRAKAAVRRQYGFVAMPFDNDQCDTWYKAILKPWAYECGYELRRMDEIATTRAMNVELIERIREAHFVIIFVPYPNSNVYFEAGVAVAFEKFVLMFTSKEKSLPFDVRSNRTFVVDELDSQAGRDELIMFLRRLRGTRV
jgi:CheY-like chemotaxis protein